MSDEEAGAEARHLDEVAAIEPGGEPEFSLAHGTGFAVAVLVIMLAEQTFLNAGPLLVKATEGGAEGAALAGFTFNVLLIARAPLQLFQAVQTSILPHLTRLGARGETDPFKRSVNVTLTAIAGFAAVVAVGMAIAGPFAMDLVFGGDFDYDRLGLVLISVGMGLYLAAATLNQALLARNQAAAGVRGWVVAAAAFVGFLLVPDFDDRVLQVEVGYVSGALALCGLLYALYRAEIGSKHGQASRSGRRGARLRARGHRRHVPALRPPRREGAAAVLPRRRDHRLHQAVLLLPRQRRGVRRAGRDRGGHLGQGRGLQEVVPGQPRAQRAAAGRPRRRRWPSSTTPTPSG